MNDLFKIEGQAPATRPSPTGGFVSVMEVTFTTKKSGITGRVDIPVNAYTPEEVAKVVGNQASLLEEVAAL